MGRPKKTNMTVGLFRFPVRLEVAVDEDSSEFKVVCTGNGTHEPVRTKQHMDCQFPDCGESHSSHWGYKDRGVETPEGMVLITTEQIAEASGTPIKDMDLAFHPRVDVYTHTVAADSVQNIYPDAGGEKGYAALYKALSDRPDVVAVTVWAPGTKNALWVLEIVEGRLIASKRAWPQDVRLAPPIAPPAEDISAVEQKMMDSAIDALLAEFEVSEYVDARRSGMTELIASRLGTAVAVSATGERQAAPVDMFAALQATVASVVKPAPVKATKKKSVAKKPAVKKAAAKQPTTKSA